MERVREIKIIVEIDTNKWTYKEEFDNIEDAKKFLESTLESINPS